MSVYVSETYPCSNDMGFINLMKKNLLFLIVVIVSLSVVPIYQRAFSNMYTVPEINHCPLCYGKVMCHCFVDGQFTLNWNYFLRNLVNILGTREKRVVFGHCNGENVVIKRLSDSFSVIWHNNSNVVSLSEKSIVNLLKKISEPQPQINSTSTKRFQICPTTENLDTFLAFGKNHFLSDNSTEYYLNVLYMLEINVEPIIQQVLKEWNVAEFLGGCGRIAVSKYCGNSLTWLAPKLNWAERSGIALQLLKFAFNATFRNPYFAFYFTDMTPDNIAVSPTGDVRLVDLEDVIVVDKHPQDEPDDWNVWHQSYHDDSEEGFSFSAQEVCSHQISDLNIYAICQGILSDKSHLISGGLLHSPPSNLMYLKGLINECISPSTKKSRFNIAQEIINKLDNS